jgi:hypothetical protein
MLTAPMANPNGHAASLVPAPPGNTRGLKHGVYSTRREITPEVQEIAASLMELPHVTDSDYAAAIEIGKLVVLIDRIDAALADGKVERRGHLRTLVDQRRRMSAQLERWYAAFGLTPASRFEFAQRLSGSLAEEIERRIAERRVREEAAE